MEGRAKDKTLLRSVERGPPLNSKTKVFSKYNKPSNRLFHFRLPKPNSLSSLPFWFCPPGTKNLIPSSVLHITIHHDTRQTLVATSVNIAMNKGEASFSADVFVHRSFYQLFHHPKIQNKASTAIISNIKQIEIVAALLKVLIVTDLDGG